MIAPREVYSPGTVQSFFEWLTEDYRIIIDPDKDFKDYGVFTSFEATLLNIIMETCFNVCDEGQEDIYEIAKSVNDYNRKEWVELGYKPAVRRF